MFTAAFVYHQPLQANNRKVQNFINTTTTHTQSYILCGQSTSAFEARLNIHNQMRVTALCVGNANELDCTADSFN